MEHCITQKSWWDTVDMLAVNGVGPILAQFPEEIPAYNKKWINSDNFWLQRTAILFQLKYKDKTDFELLKSNILNVAESNEFFLQKAAGWALRQYSKINPEVVREFINEHQLKPLTVREGKKYL